MSAPTPSPERRWVHDGLFSLSACTPDNPCTADGVLCGYSDELVQLTVVGVEQIPPTPAPSPDPRSPEDGAGAPTPFETFQAGMFAGIMAERVAGRDPQDWTEGEVRREFRDWLEERAAATPANGATR